MIGSFLTNCIIVWFGDSSASDRKSTQRVARTAEKIIGSSLPEEEGAKYERTFMASQLIDWLIQEGEAGTRAEAEQLGRRLLEHGIIQHGEKCLLSGESQCHLQSRVQGWERRLMLCLVNLGLRYTINFVKHGWWHPHEVMECTRFFIPQLHHQLVIESNSILSRSILGPTQLLDVSFFSPLSNKHHFMDSNLLYQFRMNFRRRRRLMELLTEKSRLVPESHDSPFCLRKQNHDHKKHATFLSVSPSKEIKIVSAVRRSSMSSCGSSGYFSSSPTLGSSPPVLCNPKSVLKRIVTPEELLRPGAPYARKTFTIVGDAVGWGFVVRGNKPCHVQAVDPSGPAAASGMKVSLLIQEASLVLTGWWGNGRIQSELKKLLG
uniref:DEP domain containing MTOR interacting protein n=1 Tax=Laticauda laticaudata TaxID=8630 RepID=A0A8C5RKL1_LATLA